tara:strand:+ start:116 stop:310 length:195 start_codon:yes stop_codon:yes gene_type:complete
MNMDKTEALKTLINFVLLAHKRGAYSLQEAYDLWPAVHTFTHSENTNNNVTGPTDESMLETNIS